MRYSNIQLSGVAFSHAGIESPEQFVIQIESVMPHLKMSHIAIGSQGMRLFVDRQEVEGNSHHEAAFIYQPKSAFSQFDELMDGQGVYWIFFKNPRNLARLLSYVQEQFSDDSLVYYRLKLKPLVANFIWGGDEQALTLSKLAVYIPNQDNTSNVSSIIFSARSDAGLLKSGVIGFLRSKYKLIIRVASMKLSTDDGSRPSRLLVDGFGNMKCGAFKDASKYGDIVKFIDHLGERELLVRTESNPLDRRVIEDVLESSDEP